MQEEKFLNVLKSRMVDGIIYVSSDYATSNKLLADLSIPVVFIDRKIEKSGNMGSVQIDNYQAMKEVAEYTVKRMQWIGLKIFLDLRDLSCHVG